MDGCMDEVGDGWMDVGMRCSDGWMEGGMDEVGDKN